MDHARGWAAQPQDRVVRPNCEYLVSRDGDRVNKRGNAIGRDLRVMKDETGAHGNLPILTLRTQLISVIERPLPGPSCSSPSPPDSPENTRRTAPRTGPRPASSTSAATRR